MYEQIYCQIAFVDNSPNGSDEGETSANPPLLENPQTLPLSLSPILRDPVQPRMKKEKRQKKEKDECEFRLIQPSPRVDVFATASPRLRHGFAFQCLMFVFVSVWKRSEASTKNETFSDVFQGPRR